MKTRSRSTWDQVGGLYDRLLNWLHARKNAEKALPVAAHLELILNNLDRNEDSILGQECRSLICEARGDLPGAIKHRKNEIRKIRRLREISTGTPGEPHALKNYSVADLSDRIDLLATLYFKKGEWVKALAVLEESKQLCEDNHIKFDGEDLLQEYRKCRAPRQTSPRRREP
jgi:hypothetical protein